MKRLIMLALMMLLSVTSAGHANVKQTITILPFEGQTVHSEILDAARDVLSIFLGNHQVDVIGNDLKKSSVKPSEADETAKSVGADFYVRGRITRLGKRAIVQVEKFAVGRKSPVFTDMMTANTPSDLETVMERLALAIYTQTKAKGNHNIHTVTHRERQRLSRKRAHQNFGFGIGGLIVGVDGAEVLPTIGVSWLFDNRNVLFTADGRLGGMGTDFTFAEFSLGAYYPLDNDDITPYVGGGLSLSAIGLEKSEDPMVEDEESSGSGLGIFAAAGMIIGRTSDVSIRPEISYLAGSYSLDNSIVHGMRVNLVLGF